MFSQVASWNWFVVAFSLFCWWFVVCYFCSFQVTFFYGFSTVVLLVSYGALLSAACYRAGLAEACLMVPINNQCSLEVSWSYYWSFVAFRMLWSFLHCIIWYCLFLLSKGACSLECFACIMFCWLAILAWLKQLLFHCGHFGSFLLIASASVSNFAGLQLLLWLFFFNQVSIVLLCASQACWQLMAPLEVAILPVLMSVDSC